MNWTTDFRFLPGVCPLGAVALATSPVARDTEDELHESIVRRAKGKRSFSLSLRFDLWTSAHYRSERSREAIEVALPKLLAAQRDEGVFVFEPYTGGGAVGSVGTQMFDEPLNATYRVLEALHLTGLLAALIEEGELRGKPFTAFRRRKSIGAIVARRDFEQRPAKHDADLTRGWTEAILADQSPDGSWQGSVTLTAHALHVLADLQADKGKDVKAGIRWLFRQFRRHTAMEQYDMHGRLADPTLSTFGATTDPLAEIRIWTRLNANAPRAKHQGACWRRVGGTQSAYAVWALNRWGEGKCAEAREWIEQLRLLGKTCGCHATSVFLRLRHRAGEIELSERDQKRCSRPEMVAAAERLAAARPDLP